MQSDPEVEVAEVLDGVNYHGLGAKGVFAIVELPGLQPHIALKKVKMWVDWFFRNLAPYIQGRISRSRGKVRRAERRRERHFWRQNRWPLAIH